MSFPASLAEAPDVTPAPANDGEQVVVLRLSPKVARNLELMLNRTSAGPSFAALQLTCAFSAVVFTMSGAGALFRAAQRALEGQGAPALLLFLWGGLALFSGCAGSAQQLAILNALREHRAP